jgi:predicted O-methyltransferase YrrM
MNELSYIRQPQALARILDRTAELEFGMGSEPITGALLRTLAASKPGGRFLELGTGTGIATAWLLDGMDAASELTTVDNDARVQAVAREFLGGERRVTIVTEDGISFLRRQSEGSFDFVFADAMPGKYEALDEALNVVRVGGYYLIDDMLPQPNWPEGHGAKVPALIEALSIRPDFVITPMAWASGLVLAVRQRP